MHVINIYKYRYQNLNIYTNILYMHMCCLPEKHNAKAGKYQMPCCFCCCSFDFISPSPCVPPATVALQFNTPSPCIYKQTILNVNE